MTTGNLLLDAPDPTRPDTARYRLRLAADRPDVLRAAALRDLVFRAERGAHTPGPPGLDLDSFDDNCDHLLVHHRQVAPADPELGDQVSPAGPHGPDGQVVATYRLLPPHANDAHPRRAGLYSSTEFDLTALEPLLDRTVEAGRACVHPDHRNSTPISLLWGGIARYMQLTGYRYLIGCASFALADNGVAARSFEERAARRHAAPPEMRVRPLRAVNWAATSPAIGVAAVPPLIRAYLRLGAVVCGAPAHDPDFDTADFLLLLDLDRADPRYLRHFLGSAA